MSRMNDWPPKPGSTVITRTMSSRCRYGSRADSGVLGLDRETGGPAGRPDRLEGRRDLLRVDLDVERDRVAARLEELVDVRGRVADHQVRVERQLGPRPDPLDHLRPEGQVRDEVAVHDVDVEPVGALRLAAADRVGHVRVVGVEDAHRHPGPAAGHAQPSTPAGAGSWLRSPRRAWALSSTRRARRRATAAGAGSPARSAASWPQAAPISWPRFRRIVAVTPASARIAANALDTSSGRRGPGGVGDRVHRDQVDMGVVAAEELGHRPGVRLGVVDPADHRRLVGHPAAGRARRARGPRRRPPRSASGG